MAESKEELNSLLMRVKEDSEQAAKINTQKTKIMASIPINSWQIAEERVETLTDQFYFIGFQKHFGQWLKPQN